MGKSMNPKMSGFRKWAEIHEPTKIDKARTGANEGGAIAAADVDQDRKTSEEQLSTRRRSSDGRLSQQAPEYGLEATRPGSWK